MSDDILKFHGNNLPTGVRGAFDGRARWGALMPAGPARSDRLRRDQLAALRRTNQDGAMADSEFHLVADVSSDDCPAILPSASSTTSRREHVPRGLLAHVLPA